MLKEGTFTRLLPLHLQHFWVWHKLKNSHCRSKGRLQGCKAPGLCRMPLCWLAGCWDLWACSTESSAKTPPFFPPDLTWELARCCSWNPYKQLLSNTWSLRINVLQVTWSTADRAQEPRQHAQNTPDRLLLEGDCMGTHIPTATTFPFGVLIKRLKISANPENKHTILKQSRPVRLFNTCSLIILMPEYIKGAQYKFDFDCFVHTPVKRNWLDTVHRQYVNTLFSYDDSFA